MDSKPAAEVTLSDLFEQFVEATTMRNVLTIHHRILDYADLSPCEFNKFFPKFKRAITASRQKKNWKAMALFSKIDKRAAHKCYSNTKSPIPSSDKPCDTDSNRRNCNEDDDNSSPSRSGERNLNDNHALKNYNCLVIGSGPAGLRTAVELQLLGASRVVIVEKRGRFSRNNVLHLWPFVIDDLKSLGAKKFYGKFCAGSIDHISIRQLQLILLKVCLMIGCDFRDSCSYLDLCPASLERKHQVSKATDNSVDNQPRCDLEVGLHSEVKNNDDDVNQEKDATEPLSTVEPDQPKVSSKSREMNLRGVRAHFQCDHKPKESEMHSFEWDIILGADGRRNTLGGFFPRMEFRGRLAIAITANFINRQTTAETSVPEISGLSFIYNQDMFNTLAYDTNIELENICYYKDDTHYFVMTAKKRSLLERGVLIKDYATTKELLSDENVDKGALLKYAKDAAFWTTGLEPLDFALNHYGQEDCAMFDFTSMYAASNACRALRTEGGGFVLMGLVGDSLLEPFWPTGSGCARGFLSSFDAAWMCRQWAVNRCAVIDYHGCSCSRSSRNRNINIGDLSKPLIEPTTYDRMAMSVIAERESIYRILAQTTSENLQQNYSHWTLNPHTRYPNLNRHLVSPAQVEHLVASGREDFKFDNKMLSPKSAAQTGRRVKSPTNNVSSRRSPKKLKSAGASPMAQPKNARNQYKTKPTHKSRSRNDITIDDYYLEFEQSYKDLDDSGKGGATQYLNYKQRNSIDLDALFIPSLSGTLPSSNNLSKLEARKARDIDECLRQRRQKSKIHIVRDQLISQMRGEKNENGTPIISGGNAVLFNEIKRMREQQSRSGRADSKPRDVSSGPLSLLNSMRRCASFAERVKSFENKLGNPNTETPESVPGTPRTPIDNVKNLPQFATLQELIINNAQNSCEQTCNKTRIPVTKLSKEDWNVKCWEKRLSAHKQTGLSLSSRSLNKAVSVDTGQERVLHRFTRPKVQVDVFQDRIKDMAGKLESSKEDNQEPLRTPAGIEKKPINAASGSVRSQGWINHLKRELSKGSNGNRLSSNDQPMNPVLPNRPIKKLFEDDDEDDDGIDVNKHYDHLCLNRPTNKYLAKGSYTSHMARTKYNSATSKVINRPKPTAESKQAYLAAISSRGSSASSTLSDYSTNTGNSSSGSAGAKTRSMTRSSLIDVECFRCKKFVSTADRITLGSSSLHRSCLTCGSCGLTLRTNEIQHYLDATSSKRSDVQQEGDTISFFCAICKPDIRADLCREADRKLNAMDGYDQNQRRMKSREEFLSTVINYSELYKNILEGDSDVRVSGTSATNDSQLQRPSKITPSPIQVTLPLKLITRSRTETPNSEAVKKDKRTGENESESGDESGDETSGRRSSEFSIVESHMVDGREQVTVILPSIATAERESDPSQGGQASASSRRVSKESEMIDEEELQRILHLDNRKTSRESSHTSLSGGNTDENDTSCVDDDDDDDDDDDAEKEERDSVSNDSNRQRQREGGSTSSLDQRRLNGSSSTGVEESSASTDDNSSSLDIQSDSE